MENTQTNPQPLVNGSNIHNFEEKLKAVTEKNKPGKVGKFTHDELMKAVYFIWDAYDRSLISLFLIGQTAAQATRDIPLSGDKVEIGMRYNERHSGGWNILINFAPPVKETEDMVTFMCGDIPVECRIFAEDMYFDSPSMIYWQAETFFVPNPYEGYVKTYEKVGEK